MPSVSQAQSRLMAAAAHTKGGYGGVPQSVGREFNAADTGRKRSTLPVRVHRDAGGPVFGYGGLSPGLGAIGQSSPVAAPSMGGGYFPPQVPAPSPVASPSPSGPFLRTGTPALPTPGLGSVAAQTQAPAYAMSGIGRLSPTAQGAYGMRSGGIPHRQLGGMLKPPAQLPWFVRNESRQMAHVGPVRGPTLGRADAKPINVPGGSYVLPASHVSALGQGNSAAGHALLGRMFSSGPFGASIPKGGRGMGLPKPPKLGAGLARGGKAKEGGIVPIMISDGEHVLSPEQVKMVGHGDIGLGHRILDAWVVHEREKQVKTLKKLPRPAK
jgi:hypothetical protein